MDDKRKKIVIVDDMLVVTMKLKLVLASQYRVHTAESAAKMFEYLQTDIPDLILLDVMMPDMDGFEALAILKADVRYKEIPVIFLTSLSDEESERKGFSLGAADYLIKPFSESLLHSRIRSHLLTKRLKDAEERDNAKSRFLSVISHEIRTPMNAIVGLSELLLEEESLPAHVVSDLMKISEASDTLLKLVNDVLDISKIESGSFETVPEKYDVVNLLSTICSIHVNKTTNKPIVFKLNANADLYSELYGDDLRIKQILNNLLSNAVKYTKRGTITLTFDCKRVGNGDPELYIEVKDTGIGMHPDALESIFTAYSQADTNINHYIEGIGLGLAITKSLTELMGGEISVQSEYGKGSTFNVRIPQVFVSDKRIGKEQADMLCAFSYERRKHERKIVRPDMSYANVLVVDDFPANLDVAKGLLSKYKISVDCVASGQEAVELVRQASPVYDLIFMDYMMPEMDGIEATKLIREIGTQYAKNVTIIALTAAALSGDEKMFLDNYFNAYITKPINIVKVDAIVRRWIMKEGLIQPQVQDNEKIQNIDLEYALSLYDDDMEMLSDVLKSYIKYIPAELEKLRSVTDTDLKNYAITAHTIKGSSASIGALKFIEKARNLEQMAKTGNYEDLVAKNALFIEEVETLIKDIEQNLPQMLL